MIRTQFALVLFLGLVGISMHAQAQDSDFGDDPAPAAAPAQVDPTAPPSASGDYDKELSDAVSTPSAPAQPPKAKASPQESSKKSHDMVKASHDKASKSAAAAKKKKADKDKKAKAKKSKKPVAKKKPGKKKKLNPDEA